MTLEQINNKIARLYDSYCLECIGQGRQPVSRLQFTTDYKALLVKRLLA